jgi:rhomboid protease GluP
MTMIDLFLLQIVVLTCVALLVQRSIDRGWKLISLLILGLIGITVFYFRWVEWVWISFAIWLVWIGIPFLGYGKVGRLVRQEKFQQASQLANRLRWLHPLDGMFTYAKLLQAMAIAQQGNLQEAEALLQKCSNPKTAIGRVAIAVLYRIHARWHELLAWLNQQPSQKPILHDLELAYFYLRSLGETGQLNELIDAADRISRKFSRNPELARLYALAFCGQSKPVRQLFTGSLSKYSQVSKTFWIATADWLAGKDEQAMQQFTALRQSPDRGLQQAIDWRLAQPRVDVAQVLTPESQRILTEMGTAIAQDDQYSTRSAFQQRKAFVTYVLMFANIIVFLFTAVPILTLPFLVEYLNTPIAWEPVLFRVGTFAEQIFGAWMLVPEETIKGEWWRIISANFLHAGYLHLAVNMLGLYVYGSLIEAQLGSFKFLSAYAFSGIGAMLMVTLIGLRFGDPTQATVGASGAIMGMLGVFIAIQLKGWRTDKAAIALYQLRLGVILVITQIVSDLITPQVSMVGHLAGFGFGFLIGLVLKIKQT